MSCNSCELNKGLSNNFVRQSWRSDAMNTLLCGNFWAGVLARAGKLPHTRAFVTSLLQRLRNVIFGRPLNNIRQHISSIPTYLRACRVGELGHSEKLIFSLLVVQARDWKKPAGHWRRTPEKMLYGDQAARRCPAKSGACRGERPAAAADSRACRL